MNSSACVLALNKGRGPGRVTLVVAAYTSPRHGDVEILYGGTALYDYQVDKARLHDALLSIVSLILIFIVVYILSGVSFWLTLYVMRCPLINLVAV